MGECGACGVVGQCGLAGGAGGFALPLRCRPLPFRCDDLPAVAQVLLPGIGLFRARKRKRGGSRRNGRGSRRNGWQVVLAALPRYRSESPAAVEAGHQPRAERTTAQLRAARRAATGSARRAARRAATGSARRAARCPHAVRPPRAGSFECQQRRPFVAVASSAVSLRWPLVSTGVASLAGCRHWARGGK